MTLSKSSKSKSHRRAARRYDSLPADLRSSRAHFPVTVDEIIDERTAQLRRFFQSRFGRVWLRAVRTRLYLKFGRGHSIAFFRSRTRPSSEKLRVVEALAISLGFRPTRLDLLPHERKKLARLESFKQCVSAQLTLPGAVDDAALCAMTLHKLRPRPLKDDVFPQSFLENWCEE